MPFRGSRPLRVIVVIVAVSLAIYFGFRAVLGSRWFHHRLEQAIVERLQNVTGARVELASIEISPSLSVFRATLHGLTLHGSEGAGERPLFTGRTIVLRINPLSILRQKLMITTLEGQEITLNLITRPNGSTNIPGPEVRSHGRAELVNVSIGRLALEHANLFWNDRKIPLDLAARDSALVVRRLAGGGYRGTFTSSPVELDAGRIALPAAAVGGRFDFTSSGVTLRHLAWRSTAVSGRGSGWLEWKGGLRGSMSLDAHGGAPTIARVFGWSGVRSGQARLRCVVRYNAGGPWLSGHVGFRELRLAGLPIQPGAANLSADFNGDLRAVHLSHFSLDALGGWFVGSGAIRFASRSPVFSVRGRAEGIDLAKVLETAPRTKRLEQRLALSATLSGQGEAAWTGPFRDFRAAFTVDARPPARLPAGARPVSGEAQGEIHAGPELTLELAQAAFSTPHSSFSASGALAAHGASLQFRYSTADFKEAEPILDEITGLETPIPLALHSAAVLAGSVAGSAYDPQIRGRLSMGAFSFRGWRWQSFRGNVSASPEEVAVNAGRLQSGPSVFDFKGSASLDDWEVTPQSALLLEARADGSPLEGLKDALGVRYPVTGVASGQVDLHGTPHDLSGSGRFSIMGGSVYGEPFDEFSARVAASDAAWELHDIVLRKGAGALSGSLRWNAMARTFAVQLRGGDFSLSRLKRLSTALSRSAGAGPAVKLEGTASFVVQGSGSLSAPSIDSTLLVQNFRAGNATAGTLKASLQFASGRASGTATLRGPQGSLSLTAAADARGDWPAKITGTFSNFRLDPWLNLAGRARIQDPVIASGSLSGTGPLKSPRKLQFDARASTVAVMIPDFTVKSVQPVEVRYANGRLESNRFEIRGPLTSLRIQLSAEIGAPAEFALDAEGEAQAPLLRLFDPSLQAVGRFNIDLHDRGPVDQPALSGEIRVENLSVRYGNLPLPLSGLNGVIRLEGNRAVIQSLNEEAGQASISLSGSATLGPGRSFDIQAVFRRILLEYPAGLSSLVSGTLRLAGVPASAELSGNVTVGEMFASPDFNVVNWLGDLGSSLGTPPTAPSASFASNVRVNVHVLTDPVVHLESPTLSFVAAIDATLRGTLSQPATTGDIRLQEGSALIAGDRYQITRGDITMTSPYQTTPVLDIEARTRVERYDLTIEITGPADRIKMSYRSDPPLSTEDILSLLALGYAPRQALMTSSGSQRMGAAGAGSLLSTALSTQVSGRLQKLFGAGRLSVDPNLLGPTTSGGVRITYQQELPHNVNVAYSTNTGAAQQREVRLRWDVSDRISLIGDRDINGVYGVEVQFRRRVR